MPDISVVIVNYNVKDLLILSLTSLYKSLPSSLVIETIVVDNNSSDGSIIAIAELFPEIIIIANNFNAGFSHANNQGIDMAKGKYIFLLNPDTEIIGDAIQKLIMYIEENPRCAIVAPQLLNSDQSIQISVWKNYKVSNLILELFYLHKFFSTVNYSKQKLETTFEAKTISGAALFFRKDLINKIGKLDKNLFWMEDIDFCFRAQKHGQIMYLNNAQIIHHSGQSQKRNYNIAIANQLISKIKYLGKHNGIITVTTGYLTCFIFIVMRLIVFSILSSLRKEYRLKASAYFYALKRFLKYLFFNDMTLA